MPIGCNGEFMVAISRKSVVLQPIIDRPEYSRAIEKELIAYLDEVLFDPIDELLADYGFEKIQALADRRENAGATGALEAALQSGRVWYSDGVFCGQFNAAVSREIRELGGTPDPVLGTFKLSQDKIPFGLRHSMALAAERSQDLHREIENLLTKMEANVLGASAGLSIGKLLDRVAVDLQNQFVRQVAEIKPSEVAIGLKLDPSIAATLRTELVENLNLEIKGWASDAIVALREKVQTNALAGFRADRLAKQIAAERGISLRKANFIAEQETSLFVSKWREQRAKDIGSTRYKWSTSHDERVRPDHRLLNGKVFSFDDPPVTNRATGAKNNPGFDWRCRCVAMPIVEAD